MSTDPKACWPWLGALSQKRRGRRPVIQLGARGTKVVSAARLICEWFHGPPPDPLYEAGHICPHGERDDCVNPQHLVWQTRVENEEWKRSYRKEAA